jgi:ABC-type polysaccharide/polyol phosphate transport system ATPase subunit
VNLNVDRGECVGIIGRNGSGKSTLLQMVSGITEPTEGRVQVRGRIAPLISVGVGFHPELSGRDNLHVNGAILGLTRAEVNRRFDEVVAFAELESFIDTPVKFYSSGMIVRLGFSMAIHSTPDVLVVDEVLAVGDVAFQVKCFDRMREIREQGASILVVSHALSAVRLLCDRVMVLNDGQTYYEGDPAEAISKLHELLHARPDVGASLPGDRMPIEPGLVEIEEVELIGAKGKPTRHVTCGDEVRVRVRVRALQNVAKPYLRVAAVTDAGVPLFADMNFNKPFKGLRAGQTKTFEAVWPAPFANGTYLLRTLVGRTINRGEGRRLAFGEPMTFFISGAPRIIGLVDLGTKFEEHTQ